MVSEFDFTLTKLTVGGAVGACTYGKCRVRVLRLVCMEFIIIGVPTHFSLVRQTGSYIHVDWFGGGEDPTNNGNC